MSDSAIILVETSVDAAQAQACSEELRDWLIGIAVAAPGDESTAAIRMHPGPNATYASPTWNEYPQPIELSITIHRERAVHHALGNYTPPDCPACGAGLDEDVHFGTVEDWLYRYAEARLSCPACGHEVLVGDWTGDFAVHVGELAVEFSNWAPLAESFLAELRERMGPRTRLIYQRI